MGFQHGGLWDEANPLLLWVLDSIDPSLKWHQASTLLRRHSSHLDWRHQLLQSTASTTLFHWCASPWRPLELATLTDLSLSSHKPRGRGESMDCPFLFQHWGLPLSSLLNCLQFSFRSFLAPEDSLSSFSSPCCFLVPGFQILYTLICCCLLLHHLPRSP